MARKILQDKFIKWLEERIEENKSVAEYNAQEKDYAPALYYSTAQEYYEYIHEIITVPGKYPEEEWFMEEDED